MKPAEVTVAMAFTDELPAGEAAESRWSSEEAGGCWRRTRGEQRSLLGAVPEGSIS